MNKPTQGTHSSIPYTSHFDFISKNEYLRDFKKGGEGMKGRSKHEKAMKWWSVFDKCLMTERCWAESRSSYHRLHQPECLEEIDRLFVFSGGDRNYQPLRVRRLTLDRGVCACVCVIKGLVCVFMCWSASALSEKHCSEIRAWVHAPAK